MLPGASAAAAAAGSLSVAAAEPCRAEAERANRESVALAAPAKTPPPPAGAAPFHLAGELAVPALAAVTVRPVSDLPAPPPQQQRRPRSMSVGDDSAATPRKQQPSAADGSSSGSVTVSPMPTPSVPKRVVRTGYVNCRWLYNQVQAARGTILIDTRAREAFEEDSIPSAISVPPMPHVRSLDELEGGLLAEQRALLAPKKRKLREVVLFGDAIKRSTSQDGSDSVNGSSSSRRSWIRQLERLFVEDGLVTTVKLLYDGFLTFKYRYPFYTTAAMLNELLTAGGGGGGLTRTRSGTHNLNYPNEILEGFLFLGNMWHAQSKQVVQHLGITHIVNASLDVGDLYASDGVQYLDVQIKDKADADIGAFFDATFAFIESAKRTQHGRVLVHCTQGISRSATLVIMYLMRANGWSLVTAVNFAVASRGVVYPNEGFIQALMRDEFRLYKGNSVSLDEVDTMLQHMLPDRPVPLQLRAQKSEFCSQCRKPFSLLEWKHKCSYCRKECCGKCTSTRLAPPERLTAGSAEPEQRPRRVCGVCVGRLWQINLPRGRKALPAKPSARCKHLTVNSLSTFGRPVRISYFEGTEPELLVGVLKTRFQVRASQVLDISLESGEPVRRLDELPDGAEVFVSVGKAGDVQESLDRARVSPQLSPPPQQRDRRAGGGRFSPRDHAPYRERSSSEGTMDTMQSQFATKPADAPRTRSFQLDMAASMTAEAAAAASAAAAHEATKERANKKFRDLWRLSFPSMNVIDREALLKIKKPKVLMDVMLGISSIATGALTTNDFRDHLVELGYSSSNRDAMVSLLETARRGGNGSVLN